MLVRGHSFGARRLTDVGRSTSHSALLSREPPPFASRSSRFDAIIVPASRGASVLGGAARLAIRLQVPMVVLCSRNADGAEVATALGRRPGCQALVVDVPWGYRHDALPTWTAAPRFHKANAFRSTDLALKRNLGLLIARLLGWSKILFLDDDIGHSVADVSPALPFGTVRRLAAWLSTQQIAGLTCRSYPDNSVVCHAKRLAGDAPGNFVTGAALGVNVSCTDQPLPFFPELYNEDWFFFSRLAAERKLACVDDVPQTPYDPFGSPARAREEEFGDLLAEGLFCLFEEQPDGIDYFARLDAADVRYWNRFISIRHAELNTVSARLTAGLDVGACDTERGLAAIRSLGASVAQLSRLTPELCADFIDAWKLDLQDWARGLRRIRTLSSVAAAVDFLGLSEWFSVGLAGSFTESVETFPILA